MVSGREAWLLAPVLLVGVLTAGVPSGPPGVGVRWSPAQAPEGTTLHASDPPAVRRARTGAWQAAVASRRWEDFVALGEAALRRPDLTEADRVVARRAYLAALFRGRASGSVEGVLRAAEGFAALGDREVVEGALRVALEVAADQPSLRVHVEQASGEIVARLTRGR